MKKRLKYCWCDMCGYNAVVPEGYSKATASEGQTECPSCADENMFSFLEMGDEIPEHVAESDPMPTYPNIE